MPTTHTPNVLNPRDGITYLNNESREALAKGYEELAQWIRESEFPIPRTVLFSDAVKFKIASSWIDDDGFVKRIGTAAKLMGGRVEKGVADDYTNNFELTLRQSGGVKVIYSVARGAVCEQKTEVKEVEKYVASDELAYDQIEADIKALRDRQNKMNFVVKTVTEEVTEYICPPSLLAKEREEVEDIPLEADEAPSQPVDNNEPLPF